jgi:hypothetical protein
VGKFFKLAYGPKVVHTPLAPNIGAQYWNPKELQAFLDANPHIKNDFPENWDKEGIILKTTNPLPVIDGIAPKDLDRALTRHELMHWKNYKDGKYLKSKNASLIGVLHSYLNELSAHGSMFEGAMKDRVPNKYKGAQILIGVRDSLKSAYPKGILKALIGIK